MVYIARYKEYVISIKIIKILVAITATAMMLVINNDFNNNTKYNCKKEKTEMGKKSHASKRLYESLTNFNVYFLDIHRNLTIVRKRKKIL